MNLGPPGYEPDALTTELRARTVYVTSIAAVLPRKDCCAGDVDAA